MVELYNGLSCPSGIPCDICPNEPHGLCGDPVKLKESEIKYDIKKQ